MARIAMAALLLAAAACGDTHVNPGGGSPGGDGGAGSGGAGGTGGAPCGAVDRSDDPAVEALLDGARRRMHETGAPGLAIAFLREGEIDEVVTLGVRRAGACDPITEDTRFRLGWFSSLLTSAAALSAREDGVIDLDASVTTLVPEFHTRCGDPEAITTHHLLSGTSGFPAMWDATCAGEDPAALGRWFAERDDLPLWSHPGEIFGLSHYGLALAALALERAEAAGGVTRSFDESVNARVVDPLGLSVTSDLDAARAGDFAEGHDPRGRVEEQISCTPIHAMDQMFGSVRDLALLARMLLSEGRGLLEPSSVRAFLEGVAPAERAHWRAGYLLTRIPWSGDVEIVTRVAWSAGIQIAMVLVPDRDAGVVLMTNSAALDLAAIATEAATLLVGPFEEDCHHLPPERWDEYAGTYVDPVGVGGGPRTVVVELSGGVLQATFGDQTATLDPPGCTLADSGADFFHARGPGLPAQEVRFWRDAGGEVFALGLPGQPPAYREGRAAPCGAAP